MSQIHRKFTDQQVKELFKHYINKEIERSYLQQILGLSKSKKRSFYGSSLVSILEVKI